MLICDGVGGGTTSACAENTPPRSGMPGTGRNYLRVRGEYGVSIPPGASFEELPPRARRILEHGLESIRQDGTTSACAENTVVAPCYGYSSGNYLRVRGEY